MENMIGLEAEFFLLDKSDNLVFPKDYDFGYDDFCILGEFRAEPGKTRAESISNFIREWYNINEKALKKGLKIDISTGYRVITPEFYTKILRTMGSKSIASCQNIYNLDLLTLTDVIVEDGVIKGHKVSNGLHIHFSSRDIVERIYKKKEETFTPVKIPISIAGNNSIAEMNLWQKTGEKNTEEKITSISNRITKPVIKFIVEELDKNVLSNYKMDTILKYRHPGFYELKSYGGFEYRSLPFNKKVLDELYSIVDFSFTKLEEL